MNNIILECNDLKKYCYDGNYVKKIIKQVSLFLKKGSISAILGKSGSGKSTLLYLLSGLEHPTSGQIFFNKKSFFDMSSYEIAKFRNKKLGFIYQFHHLLLDFTVLENVAMPLLIGNKSKKDSEELSCEMLKQLNLHHKKDHYPSALSGGERQRVAIARAFIHKPTLILADEPTGHLDTDNTRMIINLIFKFNSLYNTTFLIVTHDPLLIKKIPTLFTMKGGQLFIN